VSAKVSSGDELVLTIVRSIRVSGGPSVLYVLVGSQLNSELVRLVPHFTPPYHSSFSYPRLVRLVTGDQLTEHACPVISAAQDLAFAPLKLTRADACELLAMKLLRRFTGNSDNPADLFSLLTLSWDPLQGCPESCLADIRDIAGEDLEHGERTSALEASD
jgi:hypothetical protein